MRRETDAASLPPREEASAEAAPVTQALPWIQVSGSYFRTETGADWTPVGQNDAISWPDFSGLFRRTNLPRVEGHLRWLKAHGVNCLRLMLEYAHGKHRYLERPIGRFVPNMVQLWDDLFRLCEAHGIRILLTPYDTFWMWRRWHNHPYNVANGGCADLPSRLLLSPEVRDAVKARLTFAVERWGGSGALFAWDLWNEIHPAHAMNSADVFGEFIGDLSTHVRGLEQRLYGRSHPQTVSLFGPELVWQPHLPMREPIFRHPELDFATLHIYQQGTIDDPRDTVAAAVGMGRLVREALSEIPDGRPFLDSEHGPIHAFKDHHVILPEPFDDEYFRHMQWAHFASGAAGGGMRWPNRHPHVLTHGMRRAQRALAGFLPLIDWSGFRRRNLNEEIALSGARAACFGCGDAHQAVVWVLRRDTLDARRMLDRSAAAVAPRLTIPGLAAGRYTVTAWDTGDGRATAAFEVDQAGGGAPLEITCPPFVANLALAVRRSSAGASSAGVPA